MTNFIPLKLTKIAGVRDDDFVDFSWRSQDCLQIGGNHRSLKLPIEISPQPLPTDF